MKTQRLALLYLLSFVLLYSCSKEKSFETGGGGSVNAEWEFKENKDYKGNIDTAYLEDFGTTIKSLIIEGTTPDGKERLSIEIIGINTSAPATYKTPQVLFQYLGNTASIYESDITAAGDFTVVITKIDSVSVSGTFTGKVKDSANASKTIVDGKFSAKLKNTTVPPPPIGNGQLIFWAKSSCAAGGNITIKLSNNQTGTITTFTANAPACGAAGTASFTLPVGSYNWKANCGSQDSTSGAITIVANQCAQQEVFFAAPVNCRISDLAFYDFGSNTALYSLRSNYDVNNRVTNVRFIDSINNVVLSNWAISYPAGRVQIDADQHFVLDASSRVIEFHGYYLPEDNTSEKIIMKYTYDAAGYMTMFTMEYVDTPAIIKYKGVMEWTNGNLIKLTETDPSSSSTIRQETTYEYSATPIKNFIYNFPLPEIAYFQAAINAGKNIQNALTKETVRLVDGSTGNSQVLDVTTYDNYSIDPAPNQYVRSFRQSTQGDPNSFKVVLSYKCF